MSSLENIAGMVKDDSLLEQAENTIGMPSESDLEAIESLQEKLDSFKNIENTLEALERQNIEDKYNIIDGQQTLIDNGEDPMC